MFPDDQAVVDLSSAAIRMAVPLLFAALGGIFSERSGVFNIGLEGMMLMGAFAGIFGAFLSNDPWVGLTFALAGGGLFGLLHALLSISLHLDQIVSGITINILALGVTGLFNRVVFGVGRSWMAPPLGSFSPWKIPVIGDVPIVGPIFFQQNALAYVAFFVVLLSTVLLFYTTWGLNIRVVGEHPAAAETVGVKVTLVRYACVTTSGMLAAMGGAALSLGEVHTFTEGMTAGRGFIALAAVILAGWHPVGAVWATLLFGVADALQLRLQAFGVQVPYQFLAMLPYLLTLIVLARAVGRRVGPAALGKVYTREEA